MSSEATTLPLREPAARARAGVSGRAVGARRDALVGGLALIVILACGALLVVAAADRPSLLVPTSTSHFFPGWMAGPLGGLAPWFTRDVTSLKDIFTGCVVAMYVSYVLLLRYAPRVPARWTIAAILLAHAIFFLAPPLALTDIFNYVNYARMEVFHGLNPYTTIPVLEPHSDPAFTLSNWHELLSPYGPLFTLMTFAVVPLGVAASFWTLKGLLMVTSLATVLLVWKCARLLDRDPVAAVVLVGLNPVVLVWGLGGDHNDFFMMLFVVLAFYLLLRAERDALRRSPLLIGAGAALVTAVMIKASAAILIPIVLAGLLWSRRRVGEVALGMALAAVVFGAASIVAFGPHIPDLGTQGRLVTVLSVPNLLGLALGQGGETETLRVVLSGALVAAVAACSWLAWKRRESITAAGWASVALLVTLAWVLPWYVLWVLPLAALSGSRRLRTVALVLGAYLIVAWAPTTNGVFSAIDFHPERTSIGRLHQRYVKELLY